MQRLADGGERKVVIEGVDKAVTRGIGDEKLFSALGVPWAKPPGRLTLPATELGLYDD